MRSAFMLFVFIFTGLLVGNVHAEARAENLDQLLQQVKASQRIEGRHNQLREQRFLSEKNQQAGLLQTAEAKLKQVEANSERLKSLFEKNEAQLTELSEVLHQRTGTLGEMFGVVRQAAGDLRAVVDSSIVSAQYPGRSMELERLAASKALPTIAGLENFWFTLQQEMTETGKVARFTSNVIDTSGLSTEKEVVRIGAFNAVADGEYLTYLPESQQFIVLSRQPSQIHLGLAESLKNKQLSGQTPMTIDPTRGAILGMLVQSPSVVERVQQGGVIGYIILGLGLLGIIVAVERLIRLSLVGRNIKKQLANPSQPCDKNPLGRVLNVFDQHQTEDLETIELRLDEAILKETPSLSRGVRIVKLLAAIAPLLGLLGTVTGMIGTFQAITLFGTGDPKLMAGGISQALVTTMLGLIVAVPLLFMHAGIAARSQRFIQVLDEQSAGLVARRIDQR